MLETANGEEEVGNLSGNKEFGGERCKNMFTTQQTGQTGDMDYVTFLQIHLKSTSV